MDQSLAVWILVALALITANLPFVVERPFLVLPWAQSGEPARASGLRWVESLVFFCLVVALGYGALLLIGRAFFSGSSAAAVVLFLLKLVGFFVVAAVLLGYAGWRDRGHVVKKSFFVRLIEVLVFYGLVGALGFAFEANIGNRFHQTWEFYVVTLSLFLVLGYPGFVFRYLLRNRRINESYPE
jgi:energy-converting hydrogenase Eha subunit A